MPYKLFPHTYGGDQLRLVFSDEEERAAFNRVVQSLESRIERNRPREKRIDDFVFNTTLEKVVAEERVNDLKAVLGLQVLNIFDQTSVIIPQPKRK